MAAVGEMRMQFGFWQAPWWPLIFALFQFLCAIGVSEDRAYRLTIPFLGVGWYRIGDGRHRFFLLRAPLAETADVL